MIEIIPAILAKTYEELETLVRKFEPHTQRIHLDIIDGVFAPNETIKGYEELAQLETNLQFDIHLMVQKPAEILSRWLTSRAERLLVHAESEGDFEMLLRQIQEAGKKFIPVVNPETNPERAALLADKSGLLQFMTVHPGFQNQEFLYSELSRIEVFHNAHPEVHIMVDGGVNPETAALAKKAGASTLVCGSYLVNSKDIARDLKTLQNS